MLSLKSQALSQRGSEQVRPPHPQEGRDRARRRASEMVRWLRVRSEMSWVDMSAQEFSL